MPARHDAYRDFATHYDVHGWDWFASMYGPRLFAELETRGVRGGSALDAGCGTGTLALALADRGFRTTGLDLSGALLDVARRKDAAGRVRWVQGDVTAFDLTREGAPSDAARERAPSHLARGGAPFDLVTCVADTLNHLETLDAWGEAFRRFAAHVRPGGTLFVDAATVRGLSRMDRQSVQQVDEQALILAVVYEAAARRSTLRVTSFLREEDGRYSRAAETITEWGQPVAGILERMEAAGFDPTRIWGTGDDPEADERLFVLARRDAT